MKDSPKDTKPSIHLWGNLRYRRPFIIALIVILASLIIAYLIFDKKRSISRMPTHKEWVRALKNIPVEDMHMNRNGHYDPKQVPHFDK